MNIIKNRYIFYLISALLFVAAVVMLFSFKIKTGIDFTGGTMVEFKSSKKESIQTIKNQFKNDAKIQESSIQSSGNNQYTIRAKELNEEEFKTFKSDLIKWDDKSEILSHEIIGPTVGKDLTQKSLTGLLVAIIAIVLYIAYAFRKIPKKVSYWSFGGSAILALVHDVVITTGAFVLLSHIFGWELDSLFVVAILTILGFSVHDTIVVFDRIRENLIKHPGLDLGNVTDQSIRQTIARSLNTSLTVILVLLSMLILGGSTLRPFIATLTIGIFFGTYSSIFVASPLMYDWNKRLLKRSK